MSEDDRCDVFDIELSDGRVAHCKEVAVQEYSNCRISAGLVDGLADDSLYFRFEREGEVPLTVGLRPDEMTALMFSCSGALWALQMHALEALEGYDNDREQIEQLAGYRRLMGRMADGIDRSLHELGVPGEGYPAPVANAVEILEEAFGLWEHGLDN